MPTATRNKRGRPSFQPTAKQRHRVSVCAAAGMTQDDLAIGLGIDPDTLRKHFAFELTQGASNRRQEIVDAMFKVAKKGNVSAQKAYVALCDKGQATIIPPHPALKDPPPAKPEPKGKKQQAQEDAVGAHVGTDWADLLPTARPQ